MADSIFGTKKVATAGDVLRQFYRAMKPYIWYFIFVLISIVAASAIQVYVPLNYKKFFDILTSSADKATIAPALFSTIIFILFLNILVWIGFRLSTVLQNYFQSKVIAQLKQNAFEHLIDHSYNFFTNNFSGALVQRVNRFARAFDRLIDRLVWTIVPLLVTVTGTLIVLWRVKPVIAVIMFAWIGGIFAFNYFFSLWKVKYDIRNAEADSRTTALLADNITNQNTIQLFTGSEHERRNFRGAAFDQAAAQTLTWNLSAIFEAAQTGFMFAAEFFLFYFSIKYWTAGVFTIGTFVLVQTYFLSMTGRIWDLTRIVRDIYEGFADAKEMTDIILEPHEIRNTPGATELRVREGKIEFKNVLFSYNETRQVLNEIDLTIAPREKVALIGPSGAGKSTFVRLILRFYETTAGAILIDNQDIKHVAQESLRENVSFVPQDPILFHRSLRENIRYGRRDATDEEVLHAAKLAHCDEFIRDFPQGYDTLVGERGIKLSGGERQRVAIARAILKNAPILILDEATSSLDSESEFYIQDALDHLMKQKTVIVIAHRLSTIRKMDRILVIDNGKIVEEGNHESLLKNDSSLYKKLWNFQAGGFLKELGEEENQEKE